MLPFKVHFLQHGFEDIRFSLELEVRYLAIF